MVDRVFNVLFLCTHNSARSVLAERCIEAVGGGRFKGFSAGSTPSGRINPMALALLAELGIATDGLRSKSWDDFARPGAPRMDFIFTVCDDAAGEVCPVWPGLPITAHWGMPDPSAGPGTDVEKMLAFRQTWAALDRRLRAFAALPLAALDQLTLTARLKEIGRQ